MRSDLRRECLGYGTLAAAPFGGRLPRLALLGSFTSGLLASGLYFVFYFGGCRDGLHPDRANENQGAESTLSFLMALLEMRVADETEFAADHLLLVPGRP